MYIPVCSVELINGDCPTGWEIQYIADVVLSATDLNSLIGASLVPLCTAYAFRRIRKAIHD